MNLGVRALSPSAARTSRRCSRRTPWHRLAGLSRLGARSNQWSFRNSSKHRNPSILYPQHQLHRGSDNRYRRPVAGFKVADGRISANPVLHVAHLRESKSEVGPFDLNEALRVVYAGEGWERSFVRGAQSLGITVVSRMVHLSGKPR
jgi:hypothetical protein